VVWKASGGYDVSGINAIVDTNIFIAARNPHERGYSACRRLLDQIDQGRLNAIVSSITIAEIRAGMTPEEVPTAWRAMLTHLLTSPNYRVEPVDADIAEAAGELRSSNPLTLPDAVIVATGQLRGASFIVTQDQKLGSRQDRLPVKLPGAVD
jgi:predicted nucleic acid-binding protein